MIKVFSLITVVQSWLWGSQTVVKKGSSNGRINFTKGEERLVGACIGTLMLSGWVNDWNWDIFW